MHDQSTSHPRTGGCHCGRVRFSTTGAAFQESNCHCSICRRTTGAPFVAWFSVRRSEFRFTLGQPRSYASSAQAKRSFCDACGTQLTFEHAGFPEEIGVTTCSLDDPAALSPKDHIWVGSRLPWIRLCDGLPEFTQEREDAAPG